MLFKMCISFTGIVLFFHLILAMAFLKIETDWRKIRSFYGRTRNTNRMNFQAFVPFASFRECAPHVGFDKAEIVELKQIKIIIQIIYRGKSCNGKDRLKKLETTIAMGNACVHQWPT